MARSKGDPRTSFKILAEHLAKDFAAYMRGVELKGATTYTIDLTVPEGPSTAGGKQASQHVRLVPEASAPGGRVIIAGTANPLGHTIEIRTYEYVAAQHALRFGDVPFPVEKEQYAELVKRLIGFFTKRGMSVSVVSTPVEPTSEEVAATKTTARRQSLTGALIGGLVVLVIATAIVIALMK